MKPGRIPISIVNNEMSKRRTSAQVAFVDGDRLLGEEADALSVRFPDQVYARCVPPPPGGHCSCSCESRFEAAVLCPVPTHWNVKVSLKSTVKISKKSQFENKTIYAIFQDDLYVWTACFFVVTSI